MEQALLKPKDVARRLGITTDTLRRWRASGEGPRFLRLSARTYRYPAQWLAEWQDEQSAAHSPVQAQE